MNSTLEYISAKFGVNLERKPPIEIPNINRKIMAETLGELGLITGAEIGVAQGFHAKLLFENIPALKLYAVDVWEKYPGYNEYEDRIKRYYREAKRRLSGYNVAFMKMFSMEAAKTFYDNSLDFVYIDGAHDFRSVAEDLCEWVPKVRVGGIVYGHDYKRRIDRAEYIIHVKDVVQAYMYSHGIRPWFVLGMRGNRPDGLYVEGTQSWMMVRQEGDRLQK